MPQWIDTTHPPAFLKAAERKYIEAIVDQNKDDSLRHYLIIECWDETGKDWRPALFFEPTHEVMQTLLSELTPLWTHAHQQTFCTCARHYQRLLAAYREIEAATCAFTLTKTAIDAFCKQPHLKQPAKNAVRMLEGQTFYSQQDTANAVYAALSPFLTNDEIQAFGAAFVEDVKQGGLDLTKRDLRLKELQAALAVYKLYHAPQRPTTDECPLCHLPYSFSFFELLLADTGMIDRFMTLLVGGKVRPRYLPRMIQALEFWLFGNTDADSEYEKKMFPNGESLTGAMLTTMRELFSAIRTELLSRLSFSDASTPSISSHEATPPPPPPLATPDDNSATLPV